MEYYPIPGTDMEASRIGLGTWAIGGRDWGGTDERSAVDTIEAALGRGINLIDTAPAYGLGRSEELVGETLERRGDREDVIVATKAGIEWDGDGNVWRNSSRQRIMEEVQASLGRLRTSYIDIYQVHWPDPTVPIEETAAAMQALKDEGLVRAIGVSNHSPDQMDRFQEVAELATAQPPYNLFEREIEEDVLPYCGLHKIALLTYGSLCRGLLSGKMTAHTEFPEGDLRNDDPKFQEPGYSRYLQAVKVLDAFARQRYGKDVLSLAVRWVLDRPGTGVALWGARRPVQVVAVDRVMGWTIPQTDLVEVEGIMEGILGSTSNPGFMAPPARDENRARDG